MGIRGILRTHNGVGGTEVSPRLPLTTARAGWWIAAIYAGGIFGQYLFLGLHLYPGFIWPPVGLSIAAMYLYGNRALPPVAIAFFLLMFVTGFTSDLPVLLLVALVVAYTVQAGIGGALLRHGGYTGTMRSTRDALLLTGVALVVPLLTPSVGTTLRYVLDVLPVPAASYWSMVYAGGIFSVLVFTPVVTLLFTTQRKQSLLPVGRETFLAFALLIVVTVVLFWTTAPTVNLFLSLYAFLGVLFWIGLRLGSRRMVFSMFLVSVLGVLGILFQHMDEPSAIGSRLVAAELFIALVAPLFYIMAALVDERSRTLHALQKRTQQLEKSLVRLNNADRSKNDFIAVLAHELRNPLAPVVSALEHIKMHTTDSETRELIALAEDQTAMMRHLLDDLLDVARITRRKFHLKKEYVQLDKVMQRSADSARAFIESSGHTFVVRLPTTPSTVLADKIRLQQIITNLLYNAAKYTNSGGTILLSADHDPTYVHIYIEDNGMGVEKENLETIFEPFHQTHDQATVGTGLGVGLWLTKRLVEAHGGTIVASSEGLGHGSTFTVTLPRPHQEPQTAIEILDTQPALPTAVADTAAQNILVVDDNIAAASALQKLLEHYGHQVDVAHSGEAAIAAANKGMHHIILLDIGLPDRDGYDVARTLTRNGIKALLVAITGYGQDSDKERALQSGFHYHLTKPVSIHQVLALITRPKA